MLPVTVKLIFVLIIKLHFLTMNKIGWLKVNGLLNSIAFLTIINTSYCKVYIFFFTLNKTR